MPKLRVLAAIVTLGTATALPVPDKAMTCGLPGALLVMVMLPARAATVSGVKVMAILQVLAAASGGMSSGQVVVKPKSPLAVILEMTSPAVPLLVSVTVLGGLVVLTVRAPKATVAGVSVTAGAGAAVTVILNGVVLLPPAAVTIKPAEMLPE